MILIIFSSPIVNTMIINILRWNCKYFIMRIFLWEISPCIESNQITAEIFNGNSRIVLSTFTKIKGSQSQHGNLGTSQVSFVQMVDITGMQTDPLRTPILR